MSLKSYTQVIGPRFFLEANGELANDLLPYISKLEYSDDEKKQDELRLQVVNSSSRFTDDSRFKEGAKFRFRFGYLDDISEVKNAVISKAKPSYGVGLPMIEMVAFGLTKEMNKVGSARNHGSVSSSTIAKQMADKYKLQLDIEESDDARDQHRIQSAGETDFQFLAKLASVLNWDFYIEKLKLHFHHKRFEAPAFNKYQYFVDGTGTLKSFNPEVKLTSAAKTSTNSASNKTGEAESKGRTTTPSRRLIYSETEQTATIKGVSTPTAESDKKVVGIVGSAAASKIDMSAVKASIEVVGSPRFRARANINITGVDKIYCGNWRISKSKHVFDGKSGYGCSGEIVRDAGTAKAKDKNKVDESGGGSVPVRVTINTNRGAIQ